MFLYILVIHNAKYSYVALATFVTTEKPKFDQCVFTCVCMCASEHLMRRSNTARLGESVYVCKSILVRIANVVFE